MPRPTWFSIAKNKTDAKAADVSIHAEIGYWGVSAKQFMEQLRLLGDGVATINLSIHSPGGEVLDGWAIFNALKMHPAKVIVTVKGLAASMASVVMLAGDEIRIPKNAYVMIHRVSGGAWGDADQLKQASETVTKLEDGIVAAYAERSKISEKEIRKMMVDETWMSGDEAVSKGFADVLLASTKATATASWRDHFASAPSALFDSDDSHVPDNSTSDITDMKPEEIQALVTKGIEAGLAAALTTHGDKMKSDLSGSFKAEIENGLKPIGERLGKVEAFGDELKKVSDRLEKAENLIKSGVVGSAGGTPPVAGAGGEGGDEGGEASAFKNVSEVREALSKAKNFDEKREIMASARKAGLKV